MESRHNLPNGDMLCLPNFGDMHMAAMSKAHKEAMAQGRRESRAVKLYLEALERGRRRGPKITPEKLEDRIAKAADGIEDEPDPIKRLQLIQDRMDDEARLADMVDEPDLDDLEQDFLGVAADYGSRKGISYKAWRELGVSAATLRAAGIPRSA